MTGIALGIAAWGLVTGVAMVKSGLGVPLALLMSLVVFAGSAQLAALPLIVGGAPMWVVWATALCINLRFVVFSAQWRPYFGHFRLRKRLALGYFCADLNYVTFMHRFPEPQPAPEQVPYFIGGVTTNWLAWQVPSVHRHRRRRARADALGPRLRRHAGAARHDVLAAERPRDLDRRRRGGLRRGGRLRAAAQAQHRGRDRCRRRRRAC